MDRAVDADLTAIRDPELLLGMYRAALEGSTGPTAGVISEEILRRLEEAQDVADSKLALAETAAGVPTVPLEEVIAATEQPKPQANEHPPIVPQVIADLQARMQLGIDRYGVALQPANGRNMLQDAYEEAQDLTIYLKGEIETEKLRRAAVTELINAARAALIAGVFGKTLHSRLKLAASAAEKLNGGAR